MDTTTPALSQIATATQDPEEALDRLLRQIITGWFVLTDGQGALSKWSDPAELLFGLKPDDALMEPFFGKLVSPTGLTPEAEAWRSFLETGEAPGARGRLRVDANRPGGGTFAMESVFVPVKLDEGFDFSLFLEDLAFELPLDMMLRRMRQQHPVVVRALRGALADDRPPWERQRTAGTLVAFRALEDTSWIDATLRRREEEAAAAEAELELRIEMYEVPEVQGVDVYALEDARAVIDRLKWATERIEELEGRSRPNGPSEEAWWLELVARLERVERATSEASQAARQEAEALRSELHAALDRVGRLSQETARLRAVVEAPANGLHARPGADVRATTSKPPRAAREPRPGFDDDPRPMAVLDLKGRFTQLNPAFIKLVGYEEHEFAKAIWPSVLDRHVYSEQKAGFDELVAGERETATVQSTYTHGQGVVVLVSGTVRLVRDDAGEPHHLLLVAEPAVRPN